MPDSIITLQASDSMELAADRADIYVAIKGSSLVRASAAREKAREVSQFVEAIQDAGIPSETIRVERVQMEVYSGTILKNSAAVYYLRLRDVTLDLVPDVFSQISEQKHITLERCVWLYPDADNERNELLAKCIRKAMHKAEITAQTLGIKLGGVTSLQEHFSDDESIPTGNAKRSANSMGYSATQSRNDINNLPIGEYKRVFVDVKLSYLVDAPKQETKDEAKDQGLEDRD